MAAVQFIDAALDDLRRLGADAVPRVLRKIMLLEQNPEAGQPLGSDLTGFRKLVIGRNTWRVVYRIAGATVEVCEIWVVGHRRDAEVYAEASARVRAAVDRHRELVGLGDAVQRLGRLAGGVGLAAPAHQPAEPVPDWLAERLIHTVGLRREQVAALDLRQAVDLWTDYIAGKPVGE
jgi:mRNA interferase RelE/StbE